MAKSSSFVLVPDKKGVWWDVILYVPTATVLILYASQLWYSGNQNFTYLLVFLTTFICLIGFNRIFKTRLMVLPKAPVSLEVSKNQVTVSLRDQTDIELAKEVRFFSDMAGRSFGLVGVDMSGKRRQFVFHKGQFGDPVRFDEAKSALRAFK